MSIRALGLAVTCLAVATANGQRIDPAISDGGGQPKVVFVLLEAQLFNGAGEFEEFADAQGRHKRSFLHERAIAKLKSNASQSWGRIRRAVSASGARVVDRFWVVNGFTAIADKSAALRLAQIPGVKYVYAWGGGGRPVEDHAASSEEQSWMRDAARLNSANREKRFDAKIEVPWNLEKVGADRAWQQHGVTGEGVLVAVNDGGVAIAPELCRGLWRNARERINGKDDDGNGLTDDVFGYDFKQGTGFIHHANAHGTACAGLIAARATATSTPKTVVGIAPRARLMPLVGGLNLHLYQYALERGVDVMSLSFMMPNDQIGLSRGVVRLLHEHAAAAGMLCVGGAGNFGPGSRRKWPAGQQIGTPKDIPCVIAVAGILPNGKVAPASSQGPCYWKSVPFYSDYGVNRPLRKPDLTACFGAYPMWFVREPNDPGKLRIFAEKGPAAGSSSAADIVVAAGPQGNSFSGPHAAGIAALILSANYELNPWEVKRIMESTAVDSGPPGWDPQYGAGIMDAAAAVDQAKRIKK